MVIDPTTMEYGVAAIYHCASSSRDSTFRRRRRQLGCVAFDNSIVRSAIRWPRLAVMFIVILGTDSCLLRAQAPAAPGNHLQHLHPLFRNGRSRVPPAMSKYLLRPISTD